MHFYCFFVHVWPLHNSRLYIYGPYTIVACIYMAHTHKEAPSMLIPTHSNGEYDGHVWPQLNKCIHNIYVYHTRIFTFIYIQDM